MSRLRACAVGGSAFLILAGSCAGQAFFNDLAPDNSFSSNGWCVSGADGVGCGPLVTRSIAAPFQANQNGGFLPAESLVSITLALANISGTNGAVISLLTSSSSLSGPLPANVLESWSVSNLPSSSPPSLTTVVSVLNPTLQPGQQYWLMVQGLADDTMDYWYTNALGMGGGIENNGQTGWTALNGYGGVTLPAFAVNLAPVINSFAANPSTIQSGQASILSWTVSNAASTSISNTSINDYVSSTGSVSVSPPQTTSYVLTAAGNGLTATQSLTITVTPVPIGPTTGPPTNGGSFLSGPVAPGSIVAIFGTGLASGTFSASATPLPTSLGGTQVSIDGRLCPLFWVSPMQINAQVPWETPVGAGTAIVIVAGVPGSPVTFDVVPASPGILMFGNNRALAENQDSSLNNIDKPATVGSYLAVYLTGGGPVSNPVATGAVGSSTLSRATSPASATIGGQSAEIQFLGLAPGLVGLFQANLRVPSLSSGDYPLIITIGGVPSNAPMVTISGTNGGGSAPLAITSVSDSKPTALTPLYLATKGINIAKPLTVQFNGPSGYSVSQAPIRVASDGTVVVAVPLYFDASANHTAAVAMTVALVQNGQTSGPVDIEIQDLPSVSSYGVSPGVISQTFINFESMVIARRLNEFQVAQASPSNAVDTTQAQSQLKALLLAEISSRSDVDGVAANQGLAISAGTLPDGTTLQFDKNSLDIMDRILGQYVAQLAAIVSNASPAPQVRNTPNSHLRPTLRPSRPAGTWANFVAVIGAAGTVKGVFEAVSAATASDATVLDRALAVSNGIGALFSQYAKYNESAEYAATALGAINGTLGLLDNFGKELGALSYELINCTDSSQDSNSAACADAAADIAKNGKEAMSNTLAAEQNLVKLAFPQELLASVAARVALKGSEYLTQVGDCLKSDSCTNVVSTTSKFVANELSSLTGPGYRFGDAVGSAVIANSLGESGSLPDISFQSGDSFSGLADPSGGYDVLLPLNDPNFDYQNANVEAVDPESGSVLEATSADLAGIQSSGVIQVPTITYCSASDYSCGTP